MHGVKFFKGLEGFDHGEDGHHQQRWHEQWQRDAPEHAPARCAVHLGGLVEVFGNGLKPCEQDEHVEAQIRPGVDKDGPVHGPAGVREPLDGLVDQAPVHQRQRKHAGPLEDEGPQEAHHNGAEHNRVEKDRPPEGAAPDVSVQHQRGDQRKQDHDRHLEDHEDHGIGHGLLEFVVFPVLAARVDLHVRGQALEVVCAGELALREVDALAVRNCEADVDEQRRKGIEAENQQIGDQEEVRQPA